MHARMHTHTDIDTHAHTDMHTHRHRHTHTDMHRHAQTCTHRHAQTRIHRHRHAHCPGNTNTHTHARAHARTYATLLLTCSCFRIQQPHINTNGEIQTHTHTHAHTHRIEYQLPSPRANSKLNHICNVFENVSIFAGSVIVVKIGNWLPLLQRTWFWQLTWRQTHTRTRAHTHTHATMREIEKSVLCNEAIFMSRSHCHFLQRRTSKKTHDMATVMDRNAHRLCLAKLLLILVPNNMVNIFMLNAFVCLI